MIPIMGDVNENAKPGTLLGREETQALIRSFRLKFLGVADLPDWKGNKRPAWCDFMEEIEVEQTNVEIFDDSIFNERNDYFFYHEFARQIRIGSADSIRAHYKEKRPWISFDAYIFTSEMNWCLVCDHDDEFFLYRLKR